MSDQVQCPNCGGYKVSIEQQKKITTTSKVELSTMTFDEWRKWYVSGSKFTSALILFIWLPFGCCLFGILISDTTIVIDTASLTAFGLISFMPILLTLGWIITFGRDLSNMNSAYNRQKTRPRKIVVVEVIGMKYFYYCVLCGYRWTWQTDQPKPQVIVRPDLVQLGAQKLEEDRKAAAAAAWQMEQQRRNKER